MGGNRSAQGPVSNAAATSALLRAGFGCRLVIAKFPEEIEVNTQQGKIGRTVFLDNVKRLRTARHCRISRSWKSSDLAGRKAV